MNKTQETQPTTNGILRWLASITRPVLAPLAISTIFRALHLLSDIAMFALAAYAVVASVSGGGARWGLLGIVIVLALCKALFRYLEQFTGHYVAFRSLEILRTYVFSRLWPKAPAIVASQKSGEVLTSLTDDVDRIEVVYAHTVAPMITAYVLTPIVGLGLALGSGHFVALVPALVCLAFSLFAVPYLGFGASLRGTDRTLAVRRELSQHMTDSLYGMDEVLAFGHAAARAEQADRIGAQISRTSAVARGWAGARSGINATLTVVAVAATIMCFPGDSATTAALALAVFRLFVLPRSIEAATASVDASLAAARRLYDIANSPMQVADGQVTATFDSAPEVEIDGVSYRYPRQNDRGSGAEAVATQSASAGARGRAAAAIAAAPAVVEASLRVPAGGRAVILGRSGSGKSTLLHLVHRYADPDSGQIRIGGAPITQMTLESLRATVVQVSQKNQLIAGSIADNLRLGAPGASEEELWAALDVAKLAGEVREMPQQLATKVGGQPAHGRPSGYALSGGQTARLSLARALLMRPKVLLLDEFAANLNIELEAEIRAALARALPDVTILEVSHRVEAANGADVVAVMDRGHLIVLTLTSADELTRVF